MRFAISALLALTLAFSGTAVQAEAKSDASTIHQQVQNAFLQKDWEELSHLVAEEVEWLEQPEASVNFEKSVTSTFALDRLKAIREGMDEIIGKSMKICSPTGVPDGWNCSYAFQFNVHLTIITLAKGNQISSIGLFPKEGVSDG